jgi:arylformamidase
LNGTVRVIDARGRKAIDAAFLREHLHPRCRRLLLHTIDGGPHADPSKPPHFTLDAAKYLSGQTRVSLIGIDRLSIESGTDETYPVHRMLLAGREPIYVLEGLDLGRVKPGEYDLLCCPLKIEYGDGAPVRAVLLTK